MRNHSTHTDEQNSCQVPLSRYLSHLQKKKMTLQL